MDTNFILQLIENNNNYNEIFIAGATFTGTVLAIFFTLITLPIENILSKYSQDLIKRVQKDIIFVSSFVFLIISFVLNLFLLSFGANRILALLSLALTVDSVLVLALLLVHTFYMLDVRNQLNDITEGIRNQIKNRVSKSEKDRKQKFQEVKKFLNLK